MATRFDPQPDTELMMRYDAEKKSALLAYVLWFFLGWAAVHRFYLGRTTSALVMVILHGLSWLLVLVLIGYVGLGIFWLWWAIDALLLPGMTREYNNRLIDRLQG